MIFRVIYIIFFSSDKEWFFFLRRLIKYKFSISAIDQEKFIIFIVARILIVSFS